MKTTRLSPRFRAHLKALRTRAYLLDDEADRAALLGDIDALAGDMAMQFPVTEQIELESARPGDLVVLDDREAS